MLPMDGDIYLRCVNTPHQDDDGTRSRLLSIVEIVNALPTDTSEIAFRLASEEPKALLAKPIGGGVHEIRVIDRFVEAPRVPKAAL